jgi:hypothetical protein
MKHSKLDFICIGNKKMGYSRSWELMNIDFPQRGRSLEGGVHFSITSREGAFIRVGRSLEGGVH